MALCGQCEMESRTGTGAHGDNEHCACFWEGKSQAVAEAEARGKREGIEEAAKIANKKSDEFHGFHNAPDSFRPENASHHQWLRGACQGAADAAEAILRSLQPTTEEK